MGRYIQLRDANMGVGYVGGWCLKYVQDAFGTDHPYPSATASFYANYGGKNHYDLPPSGVTVPVYLSLGNVPQGHVAIRLDDNWVASSSLSGYHPKPFFYNSLDAMISDYGRYNGGAQYLGWSEFVGTVKVVGWEEYAEYAERSPIYFERWNEETANLPLGETQLKQSGINGERVVTWRIRTIDGVEQSREVIGDSTTDAVPEITYVGTYVAPEPEPPVEPPTEPTDPTEPTPPTEPIPVPPVHAQNSFISNLIRLVQALWGRLLNYINEQNSRR